MLALKGGTAINMTIFNLPRLSVDLDLDFTPNLSLEDTEKAREKITKTVESYMTEEGYFWGRCNSTDFGTNKDICCKNKCAYEPGGSQRFIKEVMDLTPEEKEYLELFETGEYRPELLFEGDEIIWNIKEHPMAIWKMKNEQEMKEGKS